MNKENKINGVACGSAVLKGGSNMKSNFKSLAAGVQALIRQLIAVAMMFKDQYLIEQKIVTIDWFDKKELEEIIMDPIANLVNKGKKVLITRFAAPKEFIQFCSERDILVIHDIGDELIKRMDYYYSLYLISMAALGIDERWVLTISLNVINCGVWCHYEDKLYKILSLAELSGQEIEQYVTRISGREESEYAELEDEGKYVVICYETPTDEMVYQIEENRKLLVYYDGEKFDTENNPKDAVGAVLLALKLLDFQQYYSSDEDE